MANGPESSSKVSPCTGIGPWMALPCSLLFMGCVGSLWGGGQQQFATQTLRVHLLSMGLEEGNHPESCLARILTSDSQTNENFLQFHRASFGFESAQIRLLTYPALPWCICNETHTELAPKTLF